MRGREGGSKTGTGNPTILLLSALGIGLPQSILLNESFCCLKKSLKTISNIMSLASNNNLHKSLLLQINYAYLENC